MIVNGYKFNGIINGFILDDNLIDGENVISDIDSQILCITKKMYNKLNIDECIDLYDRFVILLKSYLLNNPEYIIFKNVFCDFNYNELKKLKLLFKDLKKRNVCKFIICSKNLDIIVELCDYITDNNGSYECMNYFKDKKDVPFSFEFVRELEDCKNKKMDVMHNDISDLAKDVYRYVR